VKDGVHKTAQLELDSPADRKPVQLKKAGGDMLACAELQDQAFMTFMWLLLNLYINLPLSRIYKHNTTGLLLARIRSITKMRPIVTDGIVSGIVCLSVGHSREPCKNG